MSKNDSTEQTKQQPKKSKFKKLADATLGQTITRGTRPLIEKIPPEIIQVLRDLKVDNFLDVASVAMVSMLPEESEWSDKAGDFINEVSAELIRLIKEKPGKTSDNTTEGEKGDKKKSAENATSTILRILLSSELSDYSEMFLCTLDKVLEEKKNVKGFREEFFNSINKLSDKEMLMLLDHLTDLLEEGKKQELEVLISFFFKEMKEEKREQKKLSEIFASAKEHCSALASKTFEHLKKLEKYIEDQIPEPEEDPGFFKGVFGDWSGVFNKIKIWRKP